MPTKFGFEQSVYVVTTVAAFPAITAAEVNAGVQIEEDLPNPVNFSGTSNRADTSVIASRQDRSEPSTLTLASLNVEAFNRKAAANIAIPALDDDTTYYLVKFEGGNIAAGDHGTPAIGDKCDAAQVTVGTKSDVDTPRGDARRMSIPMEIISTVARDVVLT
jgi:hypothetical protein